MLPLLVAASAFTPLPMGPSHAAARPLLAAQMVVPVEPHDAVSTMSWLSSLDLGTMELLAKAESKKDAVPEKDNSSFWVSTPMKTDRRKGFGAFDRATNRDHADVFQCGESRTDSSVRASHARSACYYE